jgi:hypothetical protein
LFLGGVLLTPFSHLGLCLAILVHGLTSPPSLSDIPSILVCGLTSPPSLSAGPTENAYWPARPASGVRLERNLGGAVNSLSFRTIPVSILHGYDSLSIKALSSHDRTRSHIERKIEREREREREREILTPFPSLSPALHSFTPPPLPLTRTGTSRNSGPSFDLVSSL